MLMGEYEFADTFAEQHWMTKLLFVVFVIDMSVVLMNLVLGLAVNDVDSIVRTSNMRRMVHETLTVSYLEEIHTNLGKIPGLRGLCSGLRITSSNICQFKEVVYCNLVDIAHFEGNEIVLDRGVVNGVQKISFYPCPKTVAQKIVDILRFVL